MASFSGEEGTPPIPINTKPPLSEVEQLFRTKGIDSQVEYERQRESDPELQNIPVFMYSYNKEGWRAGVIFGEKIAR